MAQKKSTAEQIKNARRWQRHLQTSLTVGVYDFDGAGLF